MVIHKEPGRNPAVNLPRLFTHPIENANSNSKSIRIIRTATTPRAKRKMGSIISIEASERPSEIPSRESINRFLTDLSLVCKDVFDHLVEQVAERDLFDNTYRIDSTDVRADPADDEATWNYDPTADSDDSEGEGDEENADDNDEDTGEQDDDDGGFYYGYGCLLVSTGPKLPIAAAFTQRKQVVRRRRDASRMRRSPSKTGLDNRRCCIRYA